MQGRKQETGTGAETMGEWCLLACSLYLAQLVFFFFFNTTHRDWHIYLMWERRDAEKQRNKELCVIYQPRSVTALSELGRPTLITKGESTSHHIFAQRPIWWWQFLNLKSPSSLVTLVYAESTKLSCTEPYYNKYVVCWWGCCSVAEY